MKDISQAYPFRDHIIYARRLGLWLLLATGMGVVLAGDADNGLPANGPIREVVLLEDFTTERGKAWKAKSGDNVSYTLQFGVDLPGVAASLGKIRVGRRDPVVTEPARNWFTLTREALDAPPLPAGIDGFRFVLGSRTETQWWIQMVLKLDDGETYSRVIADHTFPAGKMIEYTVPLEEFVSAGNKPLSAEKARSLRGIAIVTSSPDTTLYLDRISAYRRDRRAWWLDFTTSHPATNLFERGEIVDLTFSPGGRLPENIAGFRYEISDFFSRITARRTVPWTGARRYTIRATPKVHGYYEVRAYLIDREGKRIGARSCIRSEGTVPAGLGTFAVLPCTRRENRAMFRKIRANAFFGLHGDFLGLADAVGLTWRFDYTGWNYLEPNRPDRSTGMAPWARALLQGPPMPRDRYHILSFRANLGGEAPVWARRAGAATPPAANWDDFLGMLRDSVRVERHLYPHMRKRLYGGAWEVNLNMPPYNSQQPEYTPRDVAELYRRIREVVKAEDPEGMVIGPCPSVINPKWFESVFKDGVLQYLDGIETHGYNESMFTPEANDLPAKIERLNALVRQYKGRSLPIYCTEAGHPGILGANIVHRSQAERMVRSAVIMKGEGVRVFLPFYGIDYDRIGYWGFMFNRDVDAPSGPWATKRVSPKPMVNAMAVCVRMLEGAKPISRIRTLGKDVWAYAFDRNGSKTTVVWTTDKRRTVRLSVGKAESIDVVDLMGHGSRQRSKAGAIRLTVTTSPVYVTRVTTRRPAAARPARR